MNKKKQSAFIILLIAIGIGLITSLGVEMAWFENLEMKSVDSRFRLRHRIKHALGEVRVSDQVVLVGVDQQSVDPAVSKHADRWGTGGWLTRRHWLDALPILYENLKPSVVAYDIIFLPFRTGTGGGSSNSEKNAQSIEVDTFLDQHKASFKNLILEETFPSSNLLGLLDEEGNTKFANKFYDIDDARSAGKFMPHFIAAYHLINKEVDAARSWDPADKATKNKIEELREHALPSSIIHKIAPDYSYADNVSFPFDLLTQAPVHLGFINVPRDEDGNVRRMPLIYGFRDPLNNNIPVFVPSLALKSCLSHLGIIWNEKGEMSSSTGISVIFGKEIRLWNSKQDIHIPIDKWGRLFLNFEGKIKDFNRVSYVDIFRRGKLPSIEEEKVLSSSEEGRENLQIMREVYNKIHKKVMLVGTTYTGGTDVGPCAVYSNTPFVFIHMTAVDNILRQSFLTPLSSFWTFILILTLLISVALTNIFGRASISARGILYVLGGFELIAFLLFYFNIACIPMISTGLSVLIASTAISTYRYHSEEKERLEIRKKFSNMVSGKVLKYMEDHPEKLRGERREATMFFSDVAGFTSVSENLPPDKLSQILNDYLTPMADLILARDGYVNKFAGDGIMAVWGVPEPSEDHATQACLSALEQQAKIREITPMFREKYQVELKVRMGLSSGNVSAGEMGSRNRYEYTVMGDSVNFAARLEPANKDYGTLIMIGEKTYQLARDQIVARHLDRLGVYGKKETVPAYELIGKKGEVPTHVLEGLALFEKGTEYYLKRDWVPALESFHEVLKFIPEDPPSRVFIERVKEYQVNPPPPDWNGEFIRKGK